MQQFSRVVNELKVLSGIFKELAPQDAKIPTIGKDVESIFLELKNNKGLTRNVVDEKDSGKNLDVPSPPKVHRGDSHEAEVYAVNEEMAPNLILEPGENPNIIAPEDFDVVMENPDAINPESHQPQGLPVNEQFVPQNQVLDEGLENDDTFKDMIIDYLDKNADKLIYSDNTFTRMVLGPYQKISPHQDKYLNYDLTKPNVFNRMRE